MTKEKAPPPSGGHRHSNWSYWIAIIPIAIICSCGFKSWDGDDNNHNNGPNKYVEIYDNILSEDVRSKLHSACVQWTNPNVVFEFPLKEHSASNHNYIEQVINDIVKELYSNDGNTSEFYVEYWTRNEWYHTLGHADIDEGLQRSDPNNLIHPMYGHVLYLQVGKKVRGPTCVLFDNDNSNRGGDLLLKDDGNTQEQQRQRLPKTSCCYNNDTTNMVISPSVENRLLKFNGNLVHAVPRPTDIWYTRRQPQYLQHDPEHDWGRSVLLFNVWPKAHLISGRTISQPSNTRSEGGDDDDGGDNDDDDEKEQQKVNGEESLSSLLCNERTEWSNVPIETLEKPKWYDLSYHIFEIPLLGDEYRRGTNEDVFSVQFQIISKLKDALFSSSVPYHIQLSPNTPQTTNVLFRFIDYIKYELL